MLNMRIKHLSSYVEFSVAIPEPSTHSHLCFHISVESNGFRGYTTEVWYFGSAIEDFISQLETLEESRQGEAKLVQMSDLSEHCPFRFKIFSLDSAGHMAVSAEVLMENSLGNKWLSFPNRTSITFEIDPGMLPTILADFKRFFNLPKK